MDNVGATGLNRTAPDRQALAVLLRLIPLDEIHLVYPAEGPPCYAANYLVCTRAKGHDGPHVAHGTPNRALKVWFDGE